jgi:hypothetical protein
MSGLRNLGRVFGQGKGPWERRLLVLLVGGAVFAVLVIVGAYYLDHATKSDAFCGTICHANFPEYTAHLVSDHANVDCSECHIGPGLWQKVEAKIYGSAEMVKHLTNRFHRPIELPVERMRPASVICEECHAPQTEHEDQARLISYFAADEGNTQTLTELELRITGGTASGERGVHWHVDNPPSYVALDAELQDIPWVAIMKNGELVEYNSVEAPLTAEELAALPRREMDCYDCHNREGHAYANPERSVDEALAHGSMDRSLPYLKREAVKLLTASYASRAEALQAIAGLQQFYRSQYPEVFAAKPVEIERAVAELQIIYSYSTFPVMNVTWEAYPDNVSHTDFPGCFRCHDGQHVNERQEAIPSYCDTCHSLPVTTGWQPEPVAWLPDRPAIPHAVDDVADCLLCHAQGSALPAPISHESFANESCLLCHEVMPVTGAPQVAHSLEVAQACSACHGLTGIQPYPQGHDGWPDESCLLCHQ